MRRVPKHVQKFDKRPHVRIALKTKDEKEAQRLTGIYDNFIERYWKDLIKHGQQDSDRKLFKEASALAKAHGFAYKDISTIVSGSLDEMLSRIEAVADSPHQKAPALLGTAKLSQLTLSACLDKFWSLCADRLLGKSEHQIRKYRNPRKAAIQNFIEATSNLNLGEVNRSHILLFKDWLMGKVTKMEITGNTVDKQLGYIKDILHTVAIHEEIDVNFKIMFSEIRLKEEAVSRPPFEASFLQEIFLDQQALKGMNDQAQILSYIMTETGARESEIIGLLPEDFFINEPVPYIWIRKNKIRALKTPSSDRKIPLVGVALIAAKKIAASGLTRYQKSPDGASATINKYLRENGLKPTPKHTLYSLRHTFKDRLRDAEAPEEVIDELMGHKKSGPKYGRGHMLETKQKWLQKIAFNPPKNL